jgi:hypothetical protein
MTIKKLSIKTLVRMQKKFTTIYNSTSLCGISDVGVHIGGLDDLRNLAPTDCTLITETRGERVYPYETYFVFDGVRFYAIHEKEEKP